MSLLAVDIGSSACKAVAITASGDILAQHCCGYVPEFPALRLQKWTLKRSGMRFALPVGRSLRI